LTNRMGKYKRSKEQQDRENERRSEERKKAKEIEKAEERVVERKKKIPELEVHPRILVQLMGEHKSEEDLFRFKKRGEWEKKDEDWFEKGGDAVRARKKRRTEIGEMKNVVVSKEAILRLASQGSQCFNCNTTAKVTVGEAAFCLFFYCANCGHKWKWDPESDNKKRSCAAHQLIGISYQKAKNTMNLMDLEFPSEKMWKKEGDKLTIIMEQLHNQHQEEVLTEMREKKIPVFLLMDMR